MRVTLLLRAVLTVTAWLAIGAALVYAALKIRRQG